MHVPGERLKYHKPHSNFFSTQNKIFLCSYSIKFSGFDVHMKVKENAREFSFILILFCLIDFFVAY